jgi:hypothetical protein
MTQLDDARPAQEDLPGSGVRARHRTDRAMKELFEEIRIAAMGAQVMLGFLLAVAYTGVLGRNDEADRAIWAAAVVATTAAVILLLAPVPVHRAAFGLRARREVLVVSHVVALLGLVALALGVELSVLLAVRIGDAGATGVVAGSALALLLGVWLVLPLVVRARATRD